MATVPEVVMSDLQPEKADGSKSNRMAFAVSLFRDGFSFEGHPRQYTWISTIGEVRRFSCVSYHFPTVPGPACGWWTFSHPNHIEYEI